MFFHDFFMIFLENMTFFGLGSCPKISDRGGFEPRRPTYPLRIALYKSTCLDNRGIVSLNQQKQRGSASESYSTPKRISCPPWSFVGPLPPEQNGGGGDPLAPVGARKILGVQRSGHTLKNESRLEKSRK